MCKRKLKELVALPGPVYGTALLEVELPSCEDKILYPKEVFPLKKKKTKFINKILV